MITCRTMHVERPAHPGGRRATAALVSMIAAAAILVATSWTAPTTLLAGMAEKKDKIYYGTDSPEQKTEQDFMMEEKEKEERSWQMLEGMRIYPDAGRRNRQNTSGSTSGSGTTSGSSGNNAPGGQ